MTLTEAFEDIAQRTIEEQNLEKCMEHAKPLLAVLEKIKAVPMPETSEGFFSFNVNWAPQSLAEGRMAISATLYDKKSQYPLSVSGKRSGFTIGDPFEEGPRKSIFFSVDTEGKTSVSRHDQGTPKQGGFHGEFDYKKWDVSQVKNVLPILSLWVQDNMPETATALIPKPYVSTGGHGIEM